MGRSSIPRRRRKGNDEEDDPGLHANQGIEGGGRGDLMGKEQRAGNREGIAKKGLAMVFFAAFWGHQKKGRFFGERETFY